MLSNFSDIHQLHQYDSTLLKEIIQWYYKSNDDTIIIVWNEQNKIVFVTEHAEQYFLKGEKELIGELWTSILPSDQISCIKHHFEKSREQLYLSNVQCIESEDTFEAVIDLFEMEEEQFYICKLKSTTYINDLKKIILDAERLVLASQLSAGLVHEIRNPLTSLKGFLQLIQSGVQQKEEYYKVMIKEIEKLEKITTELLHIAKPIKNTKLKESVNGMIADVVFIMSSQIDMRHVQFDINVEDELFCYCNASQIKQVLFNILKNGAEAINKSGIITINARNEDGNIIIEVVDDGPGMSEEVVRELNNPFFTTKSDGHGLGLMITFHIIENHNGKLEVMSKLDSGTIFKVILPKMKIDN